MDHHIWVFIFGLLGNISSFVVFLAPVPTFYRIIKKKSTEGFQSVPYVVALFSATMWLYYAYLKGDEMLLITINCFGCVIETVYIALYIAYATKKARIITLRLLFLLNFGGFCFLLVLSHFLAKGPTRVKVLGGICVAFSVSVFAAPLSIIRVVIRTKSVEFMPFPLSFFLTISAVTWLLYGISLKDFYVALPNVLGFTFGVLQMGLYLFYKNKNKNKEEKLPEHKGDIVNVGNKISTAHEYQKNVIAEVQISTEAAAKLSNDHQENNNKETIRNSHDQDGDKGMDNSIQPQLPVVVKCEA